MMWEKNITMCPLHLARLMVMGDLNPSANSPVGREHRIPGFCLGDSALGPPVATLATDTVLVKGPTLFTLIPTLPLLPPA